MRLRALQRNDGLISRTDAWRITRAAFTLIEVMVVVGLMLLLLGWGVPSFVRTLRKDDMQLAVSHMVEACSHARARAILQSAAMQLIIRAEDGALSVEPLPLDSDRFANDPASFSAAQVSGDPERPTPAPMQPFQASIPDDIAVELLDVNFRDHMEESEARVRFYPNGTTDEFTVVFRSIDGRRQKVSLDIITGLAFVEVIR